MALRDGHEREREGSSCRLRVSLNELQKTVISLPFRQYPLVLRQKAMANISVFTLGPRTVFRMQGPRLGARCRLEEWSRSRLFLCQMPPGAFTSSSPGPLRR
ncbi:hypothetical protein ANANG_G00202580 [Anguilla anguilla]|uniref:Uncharacterized protein n=1 Tax=Anguilla anguilla TaxID=7936 RepID=A0A9D3LY97_ANGAN|nr:hypothetical protein ANANG_G00202580 [Anguilla anguilla]